MPEAEGDETMTWRDWLPLPIVVATAILAFKAIPTDAPRVIAGVAAVSFAVVAGGLAMLFVDVVAKK